MKKVLWHAGFVVAVMMISTYAFAQEAEVGILKNGVGEVTSLAEATLVLKGGLPAEASITNIHILQEPESGKYFLVGYVSNSAISGKAVELQNQNGRLVAVAGPGIEITCTGVNCERCVPVIRKLRVRCVCEDQPLKSDAKCDMTSKLVLTVW